MPRLVPVAAVVSALVLTALSASAAPPLPAPATSRTASPAVSTDATTVAFTSDRAYVVSATVGSRVLRGRGTLPQGFTPSSVSARPARHVLGKRGAEVLVDYGNPVYSMSARGYGVFTHRRGNLRSVRLNGRPLTLTTYAEDSGTGGFRCEDGRLLLHWFDLGSRRGEQTVYRLTGTRLVEVSRTRLRRPVVSRPTSCG